MDDEYTGAVSPGGEPDVRTLPGLTIVKQAVDENMSNNCYVLTCRATGNQLLIDAAAEAGTLLPHIDTENLVAVVTTHQHWDHHRALSEIVSASGATTIAGKPDANAITEQTGVDIDIRAMHGDVVRFGDLELHVTAIAGHTPGSICLSYHDPGGHTHLWTGDCLFPGGVGATFGDEQAFAQLIDDVETRIFGEFDDDTWFYPGHGNDSTIGAQRADAATWRERGW